MMFYRIAVAFLACFPLAVQAQTFRVTLLGTSGPSLSSERAEAGILVQAGGETLLFDCGRGVPERLSQIGVGAVSKVFLTHLHSDHTQGLPILWMGMWNGRGSTPLSLWGPGPDVDQPAGTAALAANLTAGYATNTHIRRDLVEHWSAEAIQIAAHEIVEGVVYQNNGVTVTAFLVDHAPLKPAFGYRIDYAGYSAVISGDTRPSDNLVKFALNTDLLVHEVWTGAAGGGGTTADYHTNPEQAAGIFNRAKPRLAVYSHFAPAPADPTARTRAAGYGGPLQVGSDLMAVDISDKVVVTPCVSTATPIISAVTNASYTSSLPSNGTIIVWGSGFTPEGGNSLRFTRQGTPGNTVLDGSTGLYFWDKSAGQINAAPGGKLSPGPATVAVRNGCGVTSATFPVTFQ